MSRRVGVGGWPCWDAGKAPWKQAFVASCPDCLSQSANCILTTRVEFFNQHLVRFWKEKVTGVQLSRSRPFQKNDHRMVEQKHDTLVRQYVGHLRLDTASQVTALDALYEQMWLYYNLFQPVLHLCEKTIVGDKVHRKWDQAKTPYERLLASGILSPEQQACLQQLYEQTNPLQLREAIYRQLATLWEAATTQPSSAA